MDDISKKFAEAMDGFGKSLAQLAEVIASCVSVSIEDLGDEFLRILKEFDSWKRRGDESLIEWGDRLQDNGWLDDPEIRAEYQREVWSAVVSPVGWMIRRIRGG